MFGWLNSKSGKRRKAVKLDRKHLEERARRFLTGYLEANETRKPHSYRAVEDASSNCQPAELNLVQSGVEDYRIAECHVAGSYENGFGSNSPGQRRRQVWRFRNRRLRRSGRYLPPSGGAYVEDEEMTELGLPRSISSPWLRHIRILITGHTLVAESSKAKIELAYLLASVLLILVTTLSH